MLSLLLNASLNSDNPVTGNLRMDNPRDTSMESNWDLAVDHLRASDRFQDISGSSGSTPLRTFASYGCRSSCLSSLQSSVQALYRLKINNAQTTPLTDMAMEEGVAVSHVARYLFTFHLSPNIIADCDIFFVYFTKYYSWFHYIL